jgi:RNA polymerase sigma-70 factor (ECF subfamily)
MEEIIEEINILPEGYRIVLNLYLLEGMDHDEIGQILNIKPVSSRSQYMRGKQKLVVNLKERDHAR